PHAAVDYDLHALSVISQIPRDRVYKPDPVPALRRAAIIPLAPRLPAGSSDLPGGFGRASLERPPIWPCSVWGLPCPPCHQVGGALLPHLFTLATTGFPMVRRCVFCGTFPEVTLAGGWPAHCPWSPDFPPRP